MLRSAIYFILYGVIHILAEIAALVVIVEVSSTGHKLLLPPLAGRVIVSASDLIAFLRTLKEIHQRSVD